MGRRVLDGDVAAVPRQKHAVFGIAVVAPARSTMTNVIFGHRPGALARYLEYFTQRASRGFLGTSTR